MSRFEARLAKLEAELNQAQSSTFFLWCPDKKALKEIKEKVGPHDVVISLAWEGEEEDSCPFGPGNEGLRFENSVPKKEKVEVEAEIKSTVNSLLQQKVPASEIREEFRKQEMPVPEFIDSSLPITSGSEQEKNHNSDLVRLLGGSGRGKKSWDVNKGEN
jgi:hypothetical protein